jgi:hypothetical protein
MPMNPKILHHLALFAAASLLVAAPALHAAGTPPRIDPQALAHLKRMGAALAAAKALSFKTTRTVEVPSNAGQFLTLFSTAEVTMKRPDKLRVELRGEAPHFDFLYDGTTAAAYAPGSQVYSVVKAPPTIDAMLPELEDVTGIKIASAPLLFSDPYAVLERGITRAFVAGPVTVRGVPCVHLAFQSPGVNWEIWIETGERALPQRLAVTYTDQDNFPRTLVEFSGWNLQPWIRDGSFVFHPPAAAKEIPFQAVMRTEER